MNVALLFLTLLQAATWGTEYPDRPTRHLFGEWRAGDRERLEPLLLAHKNETGEEVILALLDNAEIEVIALARWWRVGEQGSSSGSLWIAQDTAITCWSSGGACFTPEPSEAAPQHRLAQAALQHLAKHQSPVTEQDEFRAAVEYFRVQITAKDAKEAPYAWPFFFFSMLVFISAALIWLPRDAHYTPDGWLKVRTYLALKTPRNSPGAINGNW